jgi:hypothetical protein
MVTAYRHGNHPIPECIVRLLFLVLLLALPAAAQAESFAYSVTANGLNFGTLHVETGGEGADYTVDVEAEATGFLGAITRSHYAGGAKGRLDPDGAPVPRIFHAISERIFKRRDTEITFADGRPATVALTPERDRTAFTDPATVTDQRLDSLSFFRTLFVTHPGTCPADGALYDGRRLLAVAFAPPEPRDGAIRCAGTYRIEKGPDHSLQKDVRAFTLVLVYPPDGGAPTTLTVTSGGNEVALTRTSD